MSGFRKVDVGMDNDGNLIYIVDGTPPEMNFPSDGSSGPMSLSDLSDVTGVPAANLSPVYINSGEAPLTHVVTQTDLDLILDQVVWHKVHEIEQPWELSNPSVVMTPDGIKFGPYLDGSAAAGALRYHGLDGQEFSVIQNLAYNMRFTCDDDKSDGIPYLRVFTRDSDGNDHDSICTGNGDLYGDDMKDGCSLGPGPFQEYVATSGSWRYDSDDGSNSEFGRGVPLSDILAKYGDQTITKITITLGWTNGKNLAGLLRWWQINVDHHVF